MSDIGSSARYQRPSCQALDVSGSYGVNVCGYDAYKGWIDKGWEKTKARRCKLKPVLVC